MSGGKSRGRRKKGTHCGDRGGRRPENCWRGSLR